MKIAILGGGNMGMTYAKAFVSRKIVSKDELLIVEKHDEKREQLKLEGVASLSADIDESIKNYDILIVAVKPQDFRVLSEKLKSYLSENQMILSIMAGIQIKQIQDLLSHKNVVRAMPNTPAQLGFGITAFTVAKDASFENISVVDMLLETTGKAIFMKDETMLDAVTALSGSGPAYFYYIVQHMIEAGKQMGMDENIAGMLVKETMMGAFQILNHSKLTIDELIAMVASKGGTTEAALNTLKQREVGPHIMEALKNAEKRAKELSGGA
ncbi:pyrroline-5-carboxylate reductase [Cytophaga aurantiaca]|uniref:pyrroline-5-carboxylate reductase n=1 Tax=Cytophaga aurantiaca TaxID=29530 RepID=UPI0003610143|nr:pyrroline-5-carboxylate reductase [Cytophaga aurantiaca]